MRGALAFCHPGKSVPEFKFKHGTTPMVRGCGRDLDHYYSGWAQFVKLVKEWQGTMVILHAKNVALHLNVSEKIIPLTSQFTSESTFDEFFDGGNGPPGATRDDENRLFTSDFHSLAEAQ